MDAAEARELGEALVKGPVAAARRLDLRLVDGTTVLVVEGHRLLARGVVVLEKVDVERVLADAIGHSMQGAGTRRAHPQRLARCAAVLVTHDHLVRLARMQAVEHMRSCIGGCRLPPELTIGRCRVAKREEETDADRVV